MNPPELMVAPDADRVIELNVPLAGRVLDGLLAHAKQQIDAGPDRVEVDWSDGELVVRVLDRGAVVASPERSDAAHGDAGLAQVGRLATALGGTMSVRPRDGGGSVVEVRLAARSEALAVRPDDVAGELSRVLVVDDNSVNRRLAAAMLGRAGLAADVVESGTEALTAMTERPYGLVLMDVQMPGLDGRAATRAWRSGTAASATERQVPIVALTAHVGQDERDACAAAGMDDYLSKPFGIEALASMCRRWLLADQAGSGESR